MERGIYRFGSDRESLVADRPLAGTALGPICGGVVTAKPTARVMIGAGRRVFDVVPQVDLVESRRQVLVEIPARVRSTHGSHKERPRATAGGGDVSRQ